MATSVVIPNRVTDAYRLANINRTEDYWIAHPGVVQVELIDAGGDEFSRARSINRGVTMVDEDVLVIADADVIPDAEDISYLFELCQDGNVHMPFDVVTFLDAFGRPDYDYDTNTSMVQVMTTKTFHEIGGHDERFVGWGFEDDAFVRRIRKAGKLLVRHPGKAYHHWHPVHWRMHDETYTRNMNLLKEYY